jgi:hypothetical protein
VLMSTAEVLANVSRLRQRSIAFARPPMLLALAVLVIAALLVVAEALMLTARHPTARLAVDGPEARVLLDGFHAPEQDGSVAFRWTTGASRIDFRQFGQGGALVLGLQIGASPPGRPAPALTLSYAGQHAITLAIDERPRTYRFLVPPAAARFGGLTVGLQSKTVTIPPDTRPVGLRLEAATLDALAPAGLVWPAPAQALANLLLLALGALLLRRLSVPLLPTAGAVAFAAIALGVTYSRQHLLTDAYVERLLVALVTLTALTYWLLPIAERYGEWIAPPRLIRVLWAITVLACLIRLAGALYPLFDAFDLELNVDRLLKTLAGTLVITKRSIEFRNGITIYPPGPYILLLPGLLLGIAPKLLVQAGIAVIDGCGALTTGALACKLGASERAATMSALIYAAAPISLTALWWGLTAQAFGQALMAPLALAILLALRQPRPRHWAAVGLLLSMALLTHIGVAILAIAWLGLIWLALRWRRTAPTAVWWRLTQVLVASGLAGFALIYLDVVGLKLQQMREVGDKVLTSGYVPAYSLIARGFLIAFGPLGLLLLPLGLLLLWRRHLPRGAAELIGSWLGAVAFFWAVELYSGLQVRYIYFLTPLACILIGLLLDGLAVRSATARRVAWAVTLLLVAQGSIYWLTGALGGVQMSMVPLLR